MKNKVSLHNGPLCLVFTQPASSCQGRAQSGVGERYHRSGYQMECVCPSLALATHVHKGTTCSLGNWGNLIPLVELQGNLVVLGVLVGVVGALY